MSLVSVLKKLDYEVEILSPGSCCGQPAFNAGHWDEARSVAKNFLDITAGAITTGSGQIILPSGSCTSMVRNFYTEIFSENNPKVEAAKIAVVEFGEFITQDEPFNRLRNILTESNFQNKKVGFHNSCHTERELRFKTLPGKLSQLGSGLEIVSLPPLCCGFGGFFSLKFSEIAAAMAKTRLEQMESLNVDTIISNDPGCLMHLKKEDINSQFKFLHTVQFLDELMRSDDRI